MTQSQSASVGGKLRQARERQGLSLSEVSDSTKVSVHALRALERNEISRIPGGVVGRGFVRSFAAAVGLDAEKTVAEFVAEFPEARVADGYPPVERCDEKPPPSGVRSSTPIEIAWPKLSRRAGIAALGALAAVAVIVFWAVLREPDEPVRPNAVATSRLAPVDSESGETSNVLAATSTRDEASLDVEDAFAASDFADLVPVANAANAPAPPTDPPQAPTESDSGLLDDDQGDDDQDREAEAPAVEPLAVVLSVRHPSWVIATADGRQVFSRLLNIGDRETLEVFQELVLTTGDAGAIVMTLNGRPARPLGRSGQTVTTRLNRTNFRDFLEATGFRQR